MQTRDGLFRITVKQLNRVDVISKATTTGLRLLSSCRQYTVTTHGPQSFITNDTLFYTQEITQWAYAANVASSTSFLRHVPAGNVSLYVNYR